MRQSDLAVGEQEASGAAPEQHASVAELEALVSTLRHDLRGLITPMALTSERLENHPDPLVQKSAKRVAETVRRVIERLNATYTLVPSRGHNGPRIG